MAEPGTQDAPVLPSARDYQQEMLQQSLRRNIVVAMDTGSGKTLIAILRIKAFLGALISLPSTPRVFPLA
jgi:ERCC4-related helicase